MSTSVILALQNCNLVKQYNEFNEVISILDVNMLLMLTSCSFFKPTAKIDPVHKKMLM